MKFIKSKAGTYILAVSGVLTAVICGVMNFVLIPVIERETEGIRCFDMNFGYGYEDAKNFLMLISEEGRNIYLHYQLPLDFIYPIVYTVFFVFVISRLMKKLTPVCIIPVLLMISDYTENICTIIMLKSTSLSPSLVSFASAVTCIKTVLMYALFAIILVCIVYRLIKRRNK